MVLGLPDRRRELLGTASELFSVRSKVFEQPSQVRLDVDVLLLGRPDHAQQDGPSSRASDAAREQRCVSQLGVTLELALGAVVVERKVGMVDEAGEPCPVVPKVVGHLHNRIG